MNKKELKCQICGENTNLKHNNYIGYQEPDKFRIYHCNNCNTASAFPRVDTSLLYENIYNSGNRVPGYHRYWKYASMILKVSKPINYLSKNESTYWGVNHALNKIVDNKKKTKILEVGSGMGYLTFSLKMADYDIIGLDISKTAVEKAIENFGNHYQYADVYEFSEEKPESADIIILTEVIEHIEEPVKFLKALKKILKPGGSLIITTPNKTTYPKNIIWASDSPPVHYWWFAEKSFKYIADILNFEISFIDFTNHFKKNYMSIDISKENQNITPLPFLNEVGQLKDESKKKLGGYFAGILRTVGQVALIKNIYLKVNDFFKSDNDIIVCGKRGPVLCVILKKID